METIVGDILTPAARNVTGPKPGVSENYQFMPTPQIINILEGKGFEVTKCMQGRSRDGQGIYTKHRVHFRKAGQQTIGDIAPEIILINSHNRGAALRFLTGFIRFICENGLVAGDIISDTNKIYHTNRNPFSLVLEHVDYATQHIDSKLEVIRAMRGTYMDHYQASEFAHRASEMKSMQGRKFVLPNDLLQVNRQEDQMNSVWNIFNRIQENIKKGNAFIESITNPNARRQMPRVRKMRPIRAIDSDLKYNQELWNLAEDYITL